MLTVKNAAIEFGNKARELGHKLNSTNGVTKNSKNNTSDDKTMLRGFFRTEKKITEEGKTYNKYPDPPKLWSEQHREPPIYADWLNKKSRASTGTDISPTPANKYVPFLKGTFTNTRRLNDHQSRRSLTLVDIVLAFCGNKSSARDIALVATGADVDKLVDSGLLTDEGVAKLMKMIAQAKDRKKSTGSISTTTAGTPLTLGVRPAGLKSDVCQTFIDLRLDANEVRKWLRIQAARPPTKPRKTTSSQPNSTSANSKPKSKSGSTPVTTSQPRVDTTPTRQTTTSNRSRNASPAAQSDLRHFVQPTTPASGSRAPRAGETRTYDQRDSPEEQGRRVRTTPAQPHDGDAQTSLILDPAGSNAQTTLATGDGDHRSSFQVIVDVYVEQAVDSRRTTRDGLRSTIRTLRGRGFEEDLVYTLAAFRRLFYGEPEP